jgi:hypothetical protein
MRLLGAIAWSLIMRLGAITWSLIMRLGAITWSRIVRYIRRDRVEQNYAIYLGLAD